LNRFQLPFSLFYTSGEEQKERPFLCRHKEKSCGLWKAAEAEVKEKADYCILETKKKEIGE